MRCFAFNAPIEKRVSLLAEYLNRDKSFSAGEIHVSLQKKRLNYSKKVRTSSYSSACRFRLRIYASI